MDRHRCRILIPIVLIITIGIFILWNFDPMQTVWMPKCPVKWLTGFDCPSCGATRALYALLHGEFTRALTFNYFLIIGCIYASCASAVLLIPCIRTTNLRKIIFGRTAAYIYILLFFAWWIFRNIYFR